MLQKEQEDIKVRLKTLEKTSNNAKVTSSKLEHQAFSGINLYRISFGINFKKQAGSNIIFYNGGHDVRS